MVVLYLITLTLVYFAYFVYAKLYKPTKFFENQGIKHLSSWASFVNTVSVMTKKKSFLDVVKEMYGSHSDERYVGSFQIIAPELIVRDLDLIKQLTVKDFDYFMDHRNFFSADSENILNRNLFSMKGGEWREMRATLSPAL